MDEVGNEGKGMWEYARDGKRYLPGQWPKGEPPVFDPSTVGHALRHPAAGGPATELPVAREVTGPGHAYKGEWL